MTSDLDLRKDSVTEDGEDSWHAQSVTGFPIDLHVLKTSVWRRRRVWLSLALLGMLIGAALHLVVPRKFAATADVYLTEPSNLDPTVAIANDLSLLQTRAVADQALDALHLDVSPASFLDLYQGVAVGDAIITITSSSTSPAEALAIANAVSRAFLSVRSNLLHTQTGLVVDGLQSQIQSLDVEVNELTTSINSLSTPTSASSSGSVLTNLINERNGDVNQVTQLETQIQQDELSDTTVTQGSRVLDTAALVRVSAKRVTATDALSGAIAGLGIGIVLLLLGTLLSDRLRTREEFANVLGAPVELTLPADRTTRRGGVRERGRRGRVLNDPGPALMMVVRRLLLHLDSSSGGSVAVVEIATPRPSALAVAVAARTLISQGRRVLMIDLARERPLGDLLRARSKRGEVEKVDIAGQQALLVVAPEDPLEMRETAPPPGVDAVLVLASVEPALGADHLARWAHEAVVVIGAKKARASAVAAAGQLLRQAKVVIRSAIVVSADHEDTSVGSFSLEAAGTEDEHPFGALKPVTW